MRPGGRNSPRWSALAGAGGAELTTPGRRWSRVRQAWREYRRSSPLELRYLLERATTRVRHRRHSAHPPTQPAQGPARPALAHNASAGQNAGGAADKLARRADGTSAAARHPSLTWAARRQPHHARRAASERAVGFQGHRRHPRHHSTDRSCPDRVGATGRGSTSGLRAHHQSPGGEPPTRIAATVIARAEEPARGRGLEKLSRMGRVSAPAGAPVTIAKRIATCGEY